MTSIQANKSNSEPFPYLQSEKRSRWLMERYRRKPNYSIKIHWLPPRLAKAIGIEELGGVLSAAEFQTRMSRTKVKTVG